MSDERQSDLNSFIGMWKKTSKNGVDYLTCVMNQEKHGEMLRQMLKDLEEGPLSMMAFRVKQKKTDKSPDWTLSYSKMQAAKPVDTSTPPPMTGAVDDIPF